MFRIFALRTCSVSNMSHHTTEASCICTVTDKSRGSMQVRGAIYECCGKCQHEKLRLHSLVYYRILASITSSQDQEGATHHRVAPRHPIIQSRRRTLNRTVQYDHGGSLEFGGQDKCGRGSWLVWGWVGRVRYSTVPKVGTVLGKSETKQQNQ